MLSTLEARVVVVEVMVGTVVAEWTI